MSTSLIGSNWKKQDNQLFAVEKGKLLRKFNKIKIIKPPSFLAFPDMLGLLVKVRNQLYLSVYINLCDKQVFLECLEGVFPLLCHMIGVQQLKKFVNILRL